MSRLADDDRPRRLLRSLCLSLALVSGTASGLARAEAVPAPAAQGEARATEAGAAISGNDALELFNIRIDRALGRARAAPEHASVELEAQIPFRLRQGACTGDRVRLHLSAPDRQGLPEITGTISWVSPVPQMVGHTVVHEAMIEVDRAALSALAPEAVAQNPHRAAPAQPLVLQLLDRLGALLPALGGE